MSIRLHLPVALAVLVGLTPTSGEAQVRASERATVSQTIDGTTITIDYARPRVRGRGEPFGDIVYIGDHRWTPGANWATTITSDKPFRMNGQDVPEGTWSMWIDLEENSWTMILDPEDSLFHTAPPEDSDEQIRFALERREGPFIESLLFWIPETRIDGFDLLLSWGRTQVPLEVEVESTVQTVVAEADGQLLEGAYEWTWIVSDSAADEDTPSTPLPFDVSWEDGHVQAVSVWEGTDEPFHSWIMPLGADWYQLGWVEDGELWELFDFWALQAVRDERGKLLGFDVKAEDDSLVAEIRRRRSAP